MPEAGTPAPIHLKLAAPLAERVLLPGDPHRALGVAQHVLERPRMLNHHRGLWGYTGTANDGEPLSVQATGMGGPSAAIVVEELIALGARTLVRIGTCGALDPDLALGDLLVASAALPADGASRALGGRGTVEADRELTAALMKAGAGRSGTVVSHDLFYDDRAGVASGWRARGALAVEMETATLLRLSELRGVRAASLLAVSDLLNAGGPDAAIAHRERIGREELEAAGLRLGAVAVAALR